MNSKKAKMIHIYVRQTYKDDPEVVYTSKKLPDKVVLVGPIGSQREFVTQRNKVFSLDVPAS